MKKARFKCDHKIFIMSGELIALLLSANMAAAWSEISKKKQKDSRVKNLKAGKCFFAEIMKWQLQKLFFIEKSQIKNRRYGSTNAWSSPLCIFLHDILLGLLNILKVLIVHQAENMISPHKGFIFVFTKKYMFWLHCFHTCIWLWKYMSKLHYKKFWFFLICLIKM